jgi:DNA repair exonuclease SbcCD ATPase subunit
MVSLEQIRALEARVEKAVTLIEKLRKENAVLEQNLMEASRSEEQTKAAYTELERKAGASIRQASESAAQIEELQARIKEAEQKAKDAELRAAESEEKAAAFERKAQAAEAEAATYRERALAAEHRVGELETRAEDLKKEQARIEEGLVHALDKLDAFEDMVMGMNPSGSDAVQASASTEVAGADQASGPESGDGQLTGEEKVEAAEDSLSAQVPQEGMFHGEENELDIF